MKKNLISAVAAGLALALAITSFGCESGNDNPVHYAYTRDRYGYDPAAAADAGDVFTYVAKPTNKLWNKEIEPETPTTGDAWAFEGTETAGYTITSESTGSGPEDSTGDLTYKDGVQAYNVCTGKFTDKEDYEYAAGKVVNTLEEVLVFDAATNTFEYYTNTSEWSCQEVVFLSATDWTNLKGKTGYDRVIGDKDTDYDINKAIAAQDADHTTPLYKRAYAFREADGEKVYHVVSRVTSKGVTVGFDQYVTKDGVVLFSDDLSSNTTDPFSPGYIKEPAPTAIGKFAFIGDGTYADGKILLTSWNNGTELYTFDDEAGTYTVDKDVSTWNPSNANNPVKTDIARDFPEKTTNPTAAERIPTYNYIADVFCKTGRTLNIAGKTVTANKIKTNLYTQELATDYKFDILLSASNKTYKAADYDKIPSLATSYEYVLQDN